MDKEDLYIQPNISTRLAQYIQKALDYLHIYAQKMDDPSVIEPELHNIKLMRKRFKKKPKRMQLIIIERIRLQLETLVVN